MEATDLLDSDNQKSVQDCKVESNDDNDVPSRSVYEEVEMCRGDCLILDSLTDDTRILWPENYDEDELGSQSNGEGSMIESNSSAIISNAALENNEEVYMKQNDSSTIINYSALKSNEKDYFKENELSETSDEHAHGISKESFLKASESSKIVNESKKENNEEDSTKHN